MFYRESDAVIMYGSSEEFVDQIQLVFSKHIENYAPSNALRLFLPC